MQAQNQQNLVEMVREEDGFAARIPQNPLPPVGHEKAAPPFRETRLVIGSEVVADWLLERGRIYFTARAGRSASSGDLLGGPPIVYGDKLAGPSFAVEDGNRGLGFVAVEGVAVEIPFTGEESYSQVLVLKPSVVAFSDTARFI